MVKLILLFLMGFVVSVLINRLFLKFAKNLGIRNIDDQVIRWKTTSKPSFGGIALYIVFLLIMAIYPIFFPSGDRSFDLQFIGIMTSATFGFLIGLTDDAYNTNPLLKFIAQAICAIVLIATGTCINLFDTYWLNCLLTFLWIVGLMNSINMLDNMDAIASIASFFALASMGLVVLITGSITNVYFVMIAGVNAAIIGFLFFNWHPSKMYMGDTGSQFLGVLLAALSIPILWNYDGINYQSTAIHFLLPLLAFIVPLTDTCTVVINRIAAKKSPFVGGRDHTTHHLSYLGLTEPLVALVMAGIGLISLGLVAIALSLPKWSYLFTTLYVGYGIIVFLSLFLISRMKKSKKAYSNEKYLKQSA